jgi:heme exporter protein C
MDKFIFNITKSHYKFYLVTFALLTLCLLPLSIFLIVNSPEDYLQGIYAKIMYVHVPSAWLALMWYSIIAACAVLFLVFKNPIFDHYATSIAPIGAIFCIITLSTGSIWGKPTWGTWWAWDARLTSVLILLFMYIGYIALRNSSSHGEKSAKIASIFAIVGFINIPIIKFSVDIWNTLHQPSSVFKLSGPSIHISMLIPLLVSALNLFFFSCLILLLRVQSLSCRKRLAKQRLRKK